MLGEPCDSQIVRRAFLDKRGYKGWRCKRERQEQPDMAFNVALSLGDLRDGAYGS